MAIVPLSRVDLIHTMEEVAFWFLVMAAVIVLLFANWGRVWAVLTASLRATVRYTRLRRWW